MIQPPSIKYEGDRNKAALYTPQAKKFADKVKHFASFRNLQVHRDTLVLQDGTVINCRLSHGLTFLTITSPLPSGLEDKKVKECWCHCGTTSGIILQSPAVGNDWVPNQYTEYKVRVCAGTRLRVLKDKIKALDFFPYREESLAGGEPLDAIDYNFYAVAQEDDVLVEGQPVKAEIFEINPCNWKALNLLSIEVLPKHKPRVIDADPNTSTGKMGKNKI